MCDNDCKAYLSVSRPPRASAKNCTISACNGFAGNKHTTINKIMTAMALSPGGLISAIQKALSPKIMMHDCSHVIFLKNLIGSGKKHLTTSFKQSRATQPTHWG